MFHQTMGDTYSDPRLPEPGGAPWQEWGLMEATLYRLDSGLGSCSRPQSPLALGGPIN